MKIRKRRVDLDFYIAISLKQKNKEEKNNWWQKLWKGISEENLNNSKEETTNEEDETKLKFYPAILIFNSSWEIQDTIYYGNRKSQMTHVLWGEDEILVSKKINPDFHYILILHSPFHYKLNDIEKIYINDDYINLKNQRVNNVETCILGEIKPETIKLKFKSGPWKNILEITQYIEEKKSL